MQATYLMRTRQDLEQVRMLNGMVLKREKAKQRQIETINELLRPFIKPWDERMYDIIDKLRECVPPLRQTFFMWAVANQGTTMSGAGRTSASSSTTRSI